MRCEELRGVLDDFLDGEVSAAARSEIAEHLEGCSECRREAEALRRLIAGAAALPRAIEPGADLWPAIAARITGDSAGRGWSPKAWRQLVLPLAAALALVVSGVVAVRSIGRDRQAAMPEGTGPVTAAAVGDPDVAVLSARYRQAREELRAVFAARRDRLSPATVKVVEENLAVIDRAVAQITTALATDPGNRELSRLLLATYENEVDLLRRAARLASEV